jgi:hypothetical protein
MKKILFLLLAAIFVFASCEGPMGPKGETGDTLEWYIREYTVQSNQWELIGGRDKLNSFFQFEVLMPELDADIFYDGKMMAYMYLDDACTIQAALPEVIHYGQYNPQNGTDDLWTETYKCDYAVGSIMFKVEYSDFYTENRPGTKTFRVVLNH